MKARWLVGVAAALGLWPSLAAAQSFTSHGGFLFDVMATGNGGLSNGTIDAYDSCYRLDINGTTYNSGGGPPEIEGRTIRMASAQIGDLRVSRAIHVPDEEGRDYARYTDTIENVGDETVAAQVRYTGNLGSDSRTSVWGSSSGDTAVTAEDTWFGTDDDDGSGDPTLAHLFWSQGAAVTPEHIGLSGDNIEVRFRVEIGPGQTVGFMFFAFQGPSQEEVRRQVESVVGNVGAAVRDLPSGGLGQQVNWSRWGVVTAPLFGLSGGDAPRRHIYSAGLTLAVRDVRERMDRAIDVAEDLGGHLMEQRETTLVFRVPVDRFDQALDQLAELGDVLSRRIEIRRDPGLIRDLEGRLEAARATKARLMEMLEATANAAEALAIEREIERLNVVIQTLEGQLRELRERIRYSTIAVLFQPIETPEIVPIPRDLFRLPFPWLDELGLPNLMAVE